MQEAFIDEKLRECKRLLLGVHFRNTSAIAFYQKLGYRIVGERKFKVGHNEYNDIVMALDI
jgi:diamine N-acetyltransferase